MIHYPVAPYHQQAYAVGKRQQFSVTEKIHSEVLSLPISPVMTEEQIREVVKAVNGYKAYFSKSKK